MMEWISSPVVAVILASLLAFVGGLLSILIHQLIRKIEIIDNRMSAFVTRDEMETKIERVRVDVDKQLIRQEDRFISRLDALTRGFEELRSWLMQRMEKKADTKDESAI